MKTPLFKSRTTHSRVVTFYKVKNTNLYILILALTIQLSCNEQTKEAQMDNFELTKEKAHKNAQDLLKEDFYWNPVQEGSPFGNDDGYDAFYTFNEWRKLNQNQSPVVFINKLIEDWGYPKFDLKELDSTKIDDYINEGTEDSIQLSDQQIEDLKKHMTEMSNQQGQDFDEEQFKAIMGQTSNGMGGKYLMGSDNAIIAVGFGQYVIEGQIDKDVRELTEIALKREEMPLILNMYIPEYRKSRMLLIQEMRKDLEKMKQNNKR